jgi:hypothetical protein
MTQAGTCYGLEIDVNKFTSNISGWALDFNGNFNGVGGVYGGMLFVQPGSGSAHWSPGLMFGVGSTPTLSATGGQGGAPGAAILFMPTATGVSQSSQGIVFESRSALNSPLNVGVYEDPFKDLDFVDVDNSNALMFDIQPNVIGFNRLYAQIGTAQALAQVTLGAGWGNTATATINGNDTMMRVQVTANGAGLGLSPNIHVVYKDGTFTNGYAWATRCDNSNPTAIPWVATSENTTTIDVYFTGGTPVAGNTYCAMILSGKAIN